MTKTHTSIVYRMKIDDMPMRMYVFSLLPSKMDFKEVKEIKKQNPPAAAPKVSSPSDTDKHYQEVIHLIKTFHNTSRLTNKFANIALGRVHKIPVLVNLANHYKDTLITMKYASETLHIHDQNKQLIKVLIITKSPKSNWLVKEQF